MTDIDKTIDAIKKTSRAKSTRESTARRKPWSPKSNLDAPDAPEGYKHRWIRAEVMGFDDRKNISARMREGWDLVRAEDYPEFDAPTIEDGKHAGVIGVGGLLLARVPIDIVEERNAYFRGMTRDQMTAVDNDLAREQHPAMPISKPERQTSVTFGGPRKEEG